MGIALPAWYADEPAIDDVERVYLKAFVDLQTCRQIGMDVGPIPWDKIRDYAGDLGLVGSTRLMFCEVLRAMDDEWMRDHARKNGTPATTAERAD
jgi:hypothetical protein